jgi:hypothetical protein
MSLDVNERGAKVADHSVVRIRSAAISDQQSAFGVQRSESFGSEHVDCVVVRFVG